MMRIQQDVFVSSSKRCRMKVQFNPAITAVKWPTNFIQCMQISVIANKEIEENDMKGPEINNRYKRISVMSRYSRE